MSHDEEQQRRSRVVVETPTARREEVYTRTTRTPDHDRGGFSTATVAIVALVAIAATALILFFWMNSGTDATNTNVNIATAPPTPLPTAPTPIMMPQQQPMQPPPIIVQQPAQTQPAPVIIEQPAPATSAPATAPPANTGADDATLESRINKSYSEDPELAGIVVSVIGGKATLIGSVKSQALKTRAERLANAVRGVRDIDNKLMVEGTP
ncbi:MAG: BON domain-containing protein [Acidobacteria bacterium]|nr:BON domain-containing protein [Acidobacteriota bacterium]